MRLTQMHIIFHIKYGFAILISDMYVNRSMVVTIEKEAETSFSENGGHGVEYKLI